MRLTTLLLAASALRCAHAQGAFGLGSPGGAAPGSSCPVADSCIKAAYTYAYDASGNTVLMARYGGVSTGANCPSYLGYTTVRFSDVNILSLTSTVNTGASGSYMGDQSVTLSLGPQCTTTFQILPGGTGDYTMLRFGSYTGAASCAPDQCASGGYYYLSNPETNASALVSSGSYMPCSAYLGTLTSITTYGYGSGLGIKSPPIALTQTATTLTYTNGGCSYTYNKVSASAAPNKLAAPLLLAAAIAAAAFV